MLVPNPITLEYVGHIVAAHARTQKQWRDAESEVNALTLKGSSEVVLFIPRHKVRQLYAHTMALENQRNVVLQQYAATRYTVRDDSATLAACIGLKIMGVELEIIAGNDARMILTFEHGYQVAFARQLTAPGTIHFEYHCEQPIESLVGCRLLNVNIGEVVTSEPLGDLNHCQDKQTITFITDVVTRGFDIVLYRPLTCHPLSVSIRELP